VSRDYKIRYITSVQNFGLKRSNCRVRGCDQGDSHVLIYTSIQNKHFKRCRVREILITQYQNHILTSHFPISLTMYLVKTFDFTIPNSSVL
jgi:hypothetical protein